MYALKEQKSLLVILFFFCLEDQLYISTPIDVIENYAIPQPIFVTQYLLKRKC